MTSFNNKNEKHKWLYVRYLAEVKGRKSQTTNAVEDSLLRFEEVTGFRDFAAFDRDCAQAYKETLRQRLNARTNQVLCASSVVSELIRVRSFFQWLLSECPKDVKYRFSDTEYLNPSKAETAKAQRSTGKKHIPSISQVRHVLRAMKAETADERKRRAFICALALTGARVKTLSMVRIKHIDLADGVLYLDAREVPTKFSKSFITPFMPVGEDFETEFRKWILYLRDELNFAPDAPVFPKTTTKSVPGAGFVNAGLSHEFYKSSTPLAASVSAAFEGAGLPRSTCHRFRDMLIQMGKDERWPVELMVCLSAAVGHNDLSVTLSSYAHPTDEKLISVFKELRGKKKKD